VQAHLGLACDRSWGGGVIDGGAQRCQAAADAVASAGGACLQAGARARV
jgi:hypothetical protein